MRPAAELTYAAVSPPPPRRAPIVVPPPPPLYRGPTSPAPAADSRAATSAACARFAGPRVCVRSVPVALAAYKGRREEETKVGYCDDTYSDHHRPRRVGLSVWRERAPERARMTGKLSCIGLYNIRSDHENRKPSSVYTCTNVTYRCLQWRRTRDFLNPAWGGGEYFEQIYDINHLSFIWIYKYVF